MAKALAAPTPTPFSNTTNLQPPTQRLQRNRRAFAEINSLPTEHEALNLNPMGTFINLVDIDSPIFKDITDEKMDVLKRMLELAKSIVWVTHRGHLDQPYQVASIAFGRSIGQEAAHVNFSHMTVSDLRHNVPRAIAEYLLQQTALDE